MYLAHSAKGDIPAQSYQEHVCNVYEMAFGNAARAGAYSKYGALMKDAVAFAARFHDLGKLAPENQQVLKSSNRESLPLHHWDAGVAALQSGDLSLTENIAALFVYSHHIGLQSLPDENAKGKGNVFRDMSLCKEGTSVKEITNRDLHDYIETHKSVLTELPEMKKSELHGSVPTPLFMRMALSCLVDADHTDTARHYNNVIPEGEILLQPENGLIHWISMLRGLLKNHWAMSKEINFGKRYMIHAVMLLYLIKGSLLGQPCRYRQNDCCYGAFAECSKNQKLAADFCCFALHKHY